MSKDTQKTEEKLKEEAQRYDEQLEKQHMRHLKHKHPDCIPIYFAKHVDAAKNLPEPTTNFILFKKDLKIQQAMYRLFEQIQVKPLHFFCLHTEKEQTKYVRLKAGPTIEELYRRFGRSGSLILIYADEDLGLGGIKKLQKCMMWILIILGTIWAVLFGLQYYAQWTIGGQTDSSQQSPAEEVHNDEWIEDIT